MTVANEWRLVVFGLILLLALGVGGWVYRDARARGHGELSPWIGIVVGGLLIAGTLPALVALAVAGTPTVQGFPTAIRLVPGVVAFVVYLRFR